MNKRSFLYIIGLIFILSFTSACRSEGVLVDDGLDDNIISIFEEVEPTKDEVEEEIFAYGPIPDYIVERMMGVSYVENEHITIEDLAYIQISHWGFDEKVHIGELIVNAQVAEEVVEIFRELFAAKYPIEKMKLIDEYGADDNLSMMDNNSSAFCYREVAGSNGKLSKHSYGLAIDINPVQNPYIKKDIILPSIGEEYLDRENFRTGMIVEGDLCYDAFTSRGWTWGGKWNTLKDYQHFEYNLP
ncbi:MAG: M15 family metallopeptidase [Tissierellaceae bacterium]|nr:M15 family metallopeptidase [Tissierellaceae bacterium]